MVRLGVAGLALDLAVVGVSVVGVALVVPVVGGVFSLWGAGGSGVVEWGCGLNTCHCFPRPGSFVNLLNLLLVCGWVPWLF